MSTKGIDCSICLANTDRIFYTLDCDHQFHAKCIQDRIDKSTEVDASCPNCRKILTPVEKSVIYQISNTNPNIMAPQRDVQLVPPVNDTPDLAVELRAPVNTPRNVVHPSGAVVPSPTHTVVQIQVGPIIPVPPSAIRRRYPRRTTAYSLFLLSVIALIIAIVASIILKDACAPGGGRKDCDISICHCGTPQQRGDCMTWGDYSSRYWRDQPSNPKWCNPSDYNRYQRRGGDIRGWYVLLCAAITASLGIFFVIVEICVYPCSEATGNIRDFWCWQIVPYCIYAILLVIMGFVFFFGIVGDGKNISELVSLPDTGLAFTYLLIIANIIGGIANYARHSCCC